MDLIYICVRVVFLCYNYDSDNPTVPVILSVVSQV
jgi:hypothetical protein